MKLTSVLLHLRSQPWVLCSWLLSIPSFSTLFHSKVCSLSLSPSLSHLFLSASSLLLLCNSIHPPTPHFLIFPPHPLSHKHPPLVIFTHPSVSLMPRKGHDWPTFLPPSPCHTADSRHAQDVVWTHKYRRTALLMRMNTFGNTCIQKGTLKHTTSAH